jgi:hypothetical protein
MHSEQSKPKVTHIPTTLTSMRNQLADVDTEIRSICQQGDLLRRDHILFRETFETLLTVCDKCNDISRLALEAQSLLEGLKGLNYGPVESNNGN